MNAYTIQRMEDGAYLGPDLQFFSRDAKRAYWFASREAASQYIDHRLTQGISQCDRLMEGGSQFCVVILPSTRPLLLS